MPDITADTSIYDTDSDSLYGGCDYADDNISRERLADSPAMPAITRYVRDLSISNLILIENCGCARLGRQLFTDFANDDERVGTAIGLARRRILREGVGNSLSPDECIDLCDFNIVDSNCHAMLRHIRDVVKDRYSKSDRLAFQMMQAVMESR